MKTPQIRFKQYSDDWIERQFDAIISKSSQTSTASGLPRVEYEDIVSGQGVLNKNIYDKSSSKKGLIFHSGDVLFGKLRPYLKNILLPDFSGIAVGDFWILQSNELLPHFVYNYVNTKHFQKIANTSIGTKMPRADWSLVSESTLYHPDNSNEQSAIGNFLCEIERYIDKSTIELDRLKQIKQASLQTMFPVEGKDVPRVRFKGFRGRWDVESLSKYLSIREDIAGISFTKEDVLSVSGEYGVVNQIVFQGRSFAGKSIANYRVVNAGNVVYTKSPLKANPYGIIKTAGKEEGIVSPLYAVYSANNNCDPDFVNAYFNDSCRLNHYLRSLVNKGAKNTLLISDQAALEGNVVFPKIEEQIAISQYFKQIDKLITIKRDELIRLKHIKASCLDGMFVKP